MKNAHIKTKVKYFSDMLRVPIRHQYFAKKMETLDGLIGSRSCCFHAQTLMQQTCEK